MSEYEGIVEVVSEIRPSEANRYMAHGYRLLRIDVLTRSGKHEDSAKGGYFVRRVFGYVVGRTADIPHYEPDQETKAAP